jgi:hypothetical protein
VTEPHCTVVIVASRERMPGWVGSLGLGLAPHDDRRVCGGLYSLKNTVRQNVFLVDH